MRRERPGVLVRWGIRALGLIERVCRTDLVTTWAERAGHATRSTPEQGVPR
jgi:hypothetical protein